jgi:putative aminopeptidase FrvX
MYDLDEAYCLQQFENLLSFDSTTSQYGEIQNYIIKELETLGFPYIVTHKGGVIADLGGIGNSLMVTAHLDDIGLMIRHIKATGKLMVCEVGGLRPYVCEREGVRIHTRDGRIYTGAIQRERSSIHVNTDDSWVDRSDYWKNIEVVIDADVKNPEDVRALGIEVGDIIALEPRFRYSNGYINSRFIDDKACVAVLLASMKYMKENSVKLKRNVQAYFSVYEEIGHGTVWMPEGIKDFLAIDIACTGPEQTSDEHKVSILAKDSRFPYHYEMTSELIETAKSLELDYVVDVLTPHYGTDGDATVLAGYDIRHAAIGPGTSASHGYERTHMDALINAHKLLLGYMLK